MTRFHERPERPSAANQGEELAMGEVLGGDG